MEFEIQNERNPNDISVMMEYHSDGVREKVIDKARRENKIWQYVIPTQLQIIIPAVHTTIPNFIDL